MKKKNKCEKGWITLTDEELEELSNQKTCDMCMNCMYVEHGDMYCDLTVDVKKKKVKWVYDNYNPTENYMWCNGKHFEEK